LKHRFSIHGGDDLLAGRKMTLATFIEPATECEFAGEPVVEAEDY
jgi:hypothetical protein